MNHVFNILKHAVMTDALIYVSRLPSLWVTLTWRQNQSNDGLEQAESRSTVFLSTAYNVD